MPAAAVGALIGAVLISLVTHRLVLQAAQARFQGIERATYGCFPHATILKWSRCTIVYRVWQPRRGTTYGHNKECLRLRGMPRALAANRDQIPDNADFCDGHRRSSTRV